jgi:hypothetical protein
MQGPRQPEWDEWLVECRYPVPAGGEESFLWRAAQWQFQDEFHFQEKSQTGLEWHGYISKKGIEDMIRASVSKFQELPGWNLTLSR